jgi:hypothetical protein
MQPVAYFILPNLPALNEVHRLDGTLSIHEATKAVRFVDLDQSDPDVSFLIRKGVHVVLAGASQCTLFLLIDLGTAACHCNVSISATTTAIV